MNPLLSAGIIATAATCNCQTGLGREEEKRDHPCGKAAKKRNPRNDRDRGANSPCPAQIPNRRFLPCRLYSALVFPGGKNWMSQNFPEQDYAHNSEKFKFALTRRPANRTGTSKEYLFGLLLFRHRPRCVLPARVGILLEFASIRGRRAHCPPFGALGPGNKTAVRISGKRHRTAICDIARSWSEPALRSLAGFCPIFRFAGRSCHSGHRFRFLCRYPFWRRYPCRFWVYRHPCARCSYRN